MIYASFIGSRRCTGSCPCFCRALHVHTLASLARSKAAACVRPLVLSNADTCFAVYMLTVLRKLALLHTWLSIPAQEGYGEPGLQ